MGFNINDVYPSGGDWMKADDLKRSDGTYGSTTGVIEKIESVEVSKRDSEEMVHKLELTLVGGDRSLLLNITNAKNIALSFGEEYDRWAGKTVAISVHSTKMGPGLLVTGVQETQPEPQRTNFDDLEDDYEPR